MKPIKVSLVFDDNGVRAEVSTHTAAALMSEGLMSTDAKLTVDRPVPVLVKPTRERK